MIYTVAVPQVRDLLLAARLILRGVIEGQAELGRELAPRPGSEA